MSSSDSEEYSDSSVEAEEPHKKSKGVDISGIEDESLKRMLKEFDTDGSGRVQKGELVNAALLLKQSRETTNIFMYFGILMTILFIVSAAVIVVMTNKYVLKAVDESKDTEVAAGRLQDRDSGYAVGTSKIINYLYVIETMPEHELQHLETIHLFDENLADSFFQANINYKWRYLNETTGKLTLEIGTDVGKYIVDSDGVETTGRLSTIVTEMERRRRRRLYSFKDITGYYVSDLANGVTAVAGAVEASANAVEASANAVEASANAYGAVKSNKGRRRLGDAAEFSDDYGTRFIKTAHVDYWNTRRDTAEFKKFGFNWKNNE